MVAIVQFILLCSDAGAITGGIEWTGVPALGSAAIEFGATIGD